MTDGAQRRALAAAALVATLVVVSTVATPLASARPAHEIPVVESPDGPLDGPEADGWAAVPASDVPLTSAPSSVPHADDTTIEAVNVQAATTDDRLYLRLEWHDRTRDESASDVRAFADAVAVQFPANRSARPPIAMGGPDNRVNVWYWSGDTGTQELLAGGAGSTTPFEEPAIDATATHEGTGENATWTVVYSRPLDATSENRTAISDDGDLDVAFAVWNGSNGERAGQKAVSEWYYFPMSGGPGGPPYQTLLWTLAGLAVVAVTAVTAFGVYRTGGGQS
ncbi:DMSO reductase [Halomicrobium mukohataei]|uniref:DMSO reductase n=1 Tax=Halomicrobium mukohataei TaxID=57705 RepID=A0A847U5A0_9EURY|nr:ethylbenzene dehydrogenase-related protein [Halomicrobium mukohataei]NLV10863.1 DMSO reductase [Halomicrobium mukohataei]